jgi:hypothetical protein
MFRSTTARHAFAFLMTAFVLAGCSTPLLADETAPELKTLGVHQTSIELKSHRHNHMIAVFGMTKDGFSIDLTSKAKYTVANDKIAKVDVEGRVSPVGTGETQVTITCAGKTFTVAVKVNLPATESSMSFRHEVMPVLSRAGCNMGACHGYSLGKNGFKLSLRGADPVPDYYSITREFASRRINRSFPESSLILTKALGEVAHEGGTRFGRDSLSHQILRRWIEQGVPADLKDTAEVVAVRMYPNTLVLRPGQKHRVQLIAEYNDGTRRDVTQLGIFNANSPQFADVDSEGMVTAGEAGETAIVGRFERTFAATSVVVLQPSETFKPTPVPQNHLVDRFVIEKLNRQNVSPSALSTDEEFLRRVWLDMIGLQPKPDEIKAFLADKDPKKREKAIDSLFERPEFVDHWSLKWGDLLQNSRTTANAPSVYLFREYMRSAIAANTPLDEFVRKIIISKGGSQEDPASVYFASSKDTNDTVERVTQVFCGVRMLCARCHAHPMENWTQADYFGLASFFNQVNTRPDTRFPNVPNSKLVQVNLKANAAINPRTNKPQMPKFLGGEELPLKTDVDRRVAYAEWLTSPKNPFFARGFVNRIWSYYFHRGIIDPVDDIRSTNPPINPELLDALTKDFVDHKFDVRHLMRQITTSATYQRSSIPNASNRHDEQNFSRFIPRRVPAEALLDSLIQATGVAENFGGAPSGFRAAQIPDASIENAFLRLFGKPQRMDACECERDTGSNMLQALHFINGASILGRVQNGNARPALLARAKMTDEEMIRDLYLWTVCRFPSEGEVKVHLEFLKSYGPKRAEAIQDMMWALLNTKDFLMVH